MSIQAIVQSLCTQGLLEQLVAGPVTPQSREIYATKEIAERLTIGPWEDQAQEERWGYVAADIAKIITGRPVNVRKLGRRHDKRNAPADLVRLSLPARAAAVRGLASSWKKGRREVWEIRSVDRLPQIRILGRFAWKNSFIALEWYERQDLPEDDWRDAMIRTVTRWRNLFADYPAHEGTYPHGYLDNANILP